MSWKEEKLLMNQRKRAWINCRLKIKYQFEFLVKQSKKAILFINLPTYTVTYVFLIDRLGWSKNRSPTLIEYWLNLFCVMLIEFLGHKEDTTSIIQGTLSFDRIMGKYLSYYAVYSQSWIILKVSGNRQISSIY